MMNIQNNNVSFGKTHVVSRLAKENHWHCAYSGKEFTSKFKPTFEHILPDSKGGRKSFDNGIPVGSAINGERGNIPLAKWLKQVPAAIKHIQNFLDESRGTMIAGKDYVKEVVRTLNKQADGVATFHGRQHNKLNTNA